MIPKMAQTVSRCRRVAFILTEEWNSKLHVSETIAREKPEEEYVPF
jgi:hypothetical protein